MRKKNFRMRKSRFTESQIVAVLKQVEGGRTVKDVCREHGISENTYYNWKSKYGGMGVSDIRKMKELIEENRHEALGNLTPTGYLASKQPLENLLYYAALKRGGLHEHHRHLHYPLRVSTIAAALKAPRMTTD
jgi:putative transposase